MNYMQPKVAVASFFDFATVYSPELRLNVILIIEIIL